MMPTRTKEIVGQITEKTQSKHTPIKAGGLELFYLPSIQLENTFNFS
jgi:hypothetical protein